MSTAFALIKNYFYILLSPGSMQGCQHLFITETTQGRKSRDISILDFVLQYFNEKSVFGAFERKSPQDFSNDYSVFPDCILG